MIVFTEADRQMLRHIAEVVGDRLHHEDGYTDQDREVVDKIEQLSKLTTTIIVISGDVEKSNPYQAFQQIVRAELAHWVPDASQRLLFRAGRALGVPQPDPVTARPDCGPSARLHSLCSEWVAGVFLYRCTTCFRLFEA